MRIDLRSDTITKPTSQMLLAMMQAEVGDDVFGDDPTVARLEHKAAELFGMEASLFCASGTMTNQLAIRLHCRPGSEVICSSDSHIYLYEGGGIALNAFSSVRTLQGDRGRLTHAQIANSINNKEDVHQPVTRLVSLENTVNKGGGSIYSLEEIVKIRRVCDENNLKLHLDGARLFNALAATGEKPEEYGKVFDTISVCLSKGLGCPVGSLLLGSFQDILQARRFRKVMGGGWRQAGYLAAAGIFALDNNIERLREDHLRAKAIGQILSSRSWINEIYPIESNIVIVSLESRLKANEMVAELAKKDVHCIAFGKDLLRFVTHLDFTEGHLGEFEKTINSL